MRKTIKTELLARVEGEGAFEVTLDGSEVVDAKFRIIEPPRFFESFLIGRKMNEAPDITSRICGICPIAYQMSASRAVEDAWGVEVDEELRQLRRLIYCGEWIESHGLHAILLHAPDFFGLADAFELAKTHRKQVETGVMLKKVGNEILEQIGGREIHPINLRIGGFYRVPSRDDLLPLMKNLEFARQAAIETTRWVSTFPFPNFEQDYEFVSLRSERGEYPIADGRVVSGAGALVTGVDLDVHEYEREFREDQVEHSSALQSTRIAGNGMNGAYFAGPLARVNLNFDRLSPSAREIAREVGFQPGCRNPFKSIVARGIEMVYAAEEAMRIIDSYRRPARPFVPSHARAGEGQGATEAPRGLLFHRYRSDEQGYIRFAKIVPPTSQNQRVIEADLRLFASRNAHLEDETLRYRCEQVIRNYDPCISCSTHALKVRVKRLSKTT